LARDPTHTLQAALARQTTRRWVAAFFASGILLGVAIKVVPPAPLMAARSLMFSKFVADDAIDEGRVNDMLSTDGVVVTDAWRYRQFVDPQLYGQLSHFAEQHKGDGTALAREILLRMSPGRTMGGCGAESLGEKVAMVARREGCCSDYAAAFQLYAGALGLPARRVETQLHTTNEYFDRLTGNWVWVDAMYRTQATDEKGQLLSHYQVREHLLEHQSIHTIELSDAPIAPETYHILFDPTQYAIAYWYPVTDVVAADEFDGQLRRFHVMRPIRQLVAYLLGVRVNPMVLASPSIVRRFRIESRIAWVALTLVAISQLLLALVVATRCLKLVQELLARRVTKTRTATVTSVEESE
jgi:hypothetical protein